MPAHARACVGPAVVVDVYARVYRPVRVRAANVFAGMWWGSVGGCMRGRCGVEGARLRSQVVLRLGLRPCGTVFRAQTLDSGSLVSVGLSIRYFRLVCKVSL